MNYSTRIGWLTLAAFANVAAAATPQSIADQLQNDIPQPIQIVPHSPALIGLQTTVKWNTYLILLDASDNALFPNNLIADLDRADDKVQNLLAKRFPVGTPAMRGSYGTTTPVDIGLGQVGFLTAAHVLNRKTPHDMCITNRVLSDTLKYSGAPILNIPSDRLNGVMSYKQFPGFHGKNTGYLIGQILWPIRYDKQQSHLQVRYPRLVGGASGAPVLVENPEKKWEIGIVSIFPGGAVTQGVAIAKMPKNELLVKLRASALKTALKWGEYTECL